MIDYLWSVVIRFFEPLVYCFNIIFGDTIDDIPTPDDLRLKIGDRGVITKCFYCNAPVRIDGNNGDYNTIPHEEYHCHLCVDIYEGNCSDYREDTTQRGNIIECHYCGTELLVDGTNDPNDDYDSTQPEIHCDNCMSDAIRTLT